VTLLAALALAGCGDAARGPDYSGPEWEHATVPGGWTLDLEFVLGSGHRIGWEWATDDGSRVLFQVLESTSTGASPLASEYANASRGERYAPQSGRYDLTWDNQATGNVTLHFQAGEGYIERLWPPGEGPGCTPPRLPAETLC
jgi:hypothetical protein